MITRLHIRDLRGLEDAELRDLREITVVLGTNAVGKNSVPEAFAQAAGFPPSCNLPPPP